MTLAVVSQRVFASALLDPAREVPRGLRAAAGVDPVRCFAVHRNNAVVALVDALAAAFPVTQALVGEEFFRAMARERVRIDPPRSPIVADYGEGFAEFIAGFAPAAGVAYLPDMARLERLRVRAYHAADAAPVRAATYQALVATPARLVDTRLSMHPACGWLHSEYAVRSIWNAHQDSADVRAADLGAIAADLPEDVLVTRPHRDVQVAPLPQGGIAWLDALRDGMTLGEAATHADLGDGSPLEWQLQALLALIVQHGLAVALNSPTES